MSRHIQATDRVQAKTINALASQGLFKPVSVTIDGKVYTFNSMWSATDYLKARGLHQTVVIKP